MKRTQIYLVKEQQQALRALSRERGVSQSEIIRDAVDTYLDQTRPKDRLMLLRQARGIWGERDDLPDFGALRQEMDRAAQGESE